MATQYGDYKILDQVSKGGFGLIYSAKKEGDKNAYILKILNEKYITVHNIKSLQKEIDILVDLNKEPQSNYIPKLYAFDKENIKGNKDKIDIINFRPYYVIDFFSKGNLFYYLENQNCDLSEKYAKFLFKKIVKGIQFCHSRNICHLDIKPVNIVFDKNFNPIIIDFGLSDRIKNEKGQEIIYIGNKGTLQYKCPEMWAKSIYKGVESDIFSLGAVLFNLLTGRVGFNTSQKSDELYKLINNNKGDDNESYWNAIKTGINKEFSKEFKELYLKMVAFKPSERPSIEDILNSEWLKEINNLKQEEENNLENEVRNYLENIYNEIKKENKEIKVAVKLQENDYKTRGGDNETKFFYHNVKLKKISDKRININHYLILNGDFSKVDFMNSLANELKEKFNFEKSEESLKLTIHFEKEQKNEENEEEIDDCIIALELFEYQNGKYLLDFMRIQGGIPEYYRGFKKIKEIILKKLI